MKTNPLLVVILFLAVFYFLLVVMFRIKNEACGGFIGTGCSLPLSVCHIEDSYPDASGNCVFILDPSRFFQ
jgi:hypothetical protein